MKKGEKKEKKRKTTDGHTCKFQRCRCGFLQCQNAWLVVRSDEDLCETTAHHVALEFSNCILVCTFRWHDGRTNPAITVILANQDRGSRFSHLVITIVQITVVNGNRWYRSFPFTPARCWCILPRPMQHSRHQVLNTACPLAVCSSRSSAVGAEGITSFFIGVLSSTSSGTIGPLLLELPPSNTGHTAAPWSSDITSRNSSPLVNGNSW